MNELCSIELLRKAVTLGLEVDEERALCAHLEQCQSCAAQIEQLAGGDAWQQEAAALLRADELDAATHESATWSDIDFSVEHLEPSTEPGVLGRLGGYDVLAILGRGGMGVVLKAFDRELKRFVAIKVLAPHLAHSSVARKRFTREAQAAAAVVNPHVIAIHQVQPTGRLPFLIMPLLTGETLAQRLAARGPLELTEVLRIGMQMAAGLAAAHDQGLVHRDVKPANIFLEKGVERVVITDFGLARAGDDVSMTRLGVVAGTPEYMSPEQARGEALDGRSDLFSLGCVLYEMATGVSPFRTSTVMATLRRIVEQPPAAMASLAPELPTWFIAIVTRLMSKDPRQRYESASELCRLLEQCLSHVQQPASLPLPAAVVPGAITARWIPSARVTGVITMLGLVGIVALGAVLQQASDAPSPAPGPKALPAAQGTMPKRIGDFRDLTTANTVTIACSEDAQLIAVGNGNPTLTMLEDGRSRVVGEWKPSVILLDARTGKPRVSIPIITPDEEAVLTEEFRVNHAEVSALAFAPGAAVLAVGTTIGQVKFFDTRTGALIGSLDDERAKLADKQAPASWRAIRRAMGSVVSLVFSPDGTQLAMCGRPFTSFSRVLGGVERAGESANEPGWLKVWDTRTGNLKHDLVGHSHANTVAFSPDGTMLASAGRWLSDSETAAGVVLWNTQNGARLRSVPTEANGGVHSVAFSPDGKQLAISAVRFDKDKLNDESVGSLSLFQIASGIHDWRVTFPRWARPITFTPDGTSIAALCGSRSVRFFDSQTGGAMGNEIQAADTAPGASWVDFALAPRNGRLVIGAVDRQHRVSVEIWSTKRDAGAGSGAPAATARTTNPPIRPRAVAEFTTRARVVTIACSADGKRIAVANGSPRFHGLKGKENLERNWTPSAEVLDTATGETIVALTLSTPSELAALAEIWQISHLEVTAIALAPNGKTLAVGNNIGQVKLFDAQTGAMVRALHDDAAKAADGKVPRKLTTLPRGIGSVASLAFAPDGRRLAVCGESFDDQARLFERVRQFDELSTGSGRVKVWNLGSGALEHDLVGHSHANSVAFSPDGSVLASAGRWRSGPVTGTGVVLWNPQTGAKVREIRAESNGSAQSVAFSPDGKLVAIGVLHFDVDRPNDAITTAISLAPVASGVVQWRSTVRGSAKPVAFFDGAVIALGEGQSVRFLEAETGTTLMVIDRPNVAARRGRWNDLAIAKQGRMWVIGGDDGERGGTVEIIDPDQ
jgi:serine/threonine-protein kinase